MTSICTLVSLFTPLICACTSQKNLSRETNVPDAIIDQAIVGNYCWN